MLTVSVPGSVRPLGTEDISVRKFPDCWQRMSYAPGRITSARASPRKPKLLSPYTGVIDAILEADGASSQKASAILYASKFRIFDAFFLRLTVVRHIRRPIPHHSQVTTSGIAPAAGPGDVRAVELHPHPVPPIWSAVSGSRVGGDRRCAHSAQCPLH